MNRQRKRTSPRRPPKRRQSLCALFVFATVACEVPPQPEVPMGDTPQRIVGGEQTHYALFKGAVGLLIDWGGGSAQLCTGTLIDPELVLTAAHCVYLPDQGVDVRNAPQKVEIAGGSDLLGMTKVSYTRGKKIVIHNGWDGKVEWGKIDLALILLEAPITQIAHYGIRETAPAEGDEGMLVGYGMVDIDDIPSAGLHRMGSSRILGVEPPLMEIGNPAGTCQGDSGGPFFVKAKDTWQLAGVVSFGTERECLPNRDTWATVLSSQKQWIEDNAEVLIGRGLFDPDGSRDSSDPDLDSETLFYPPNTSDTTDDEEETVGSGGCGVVEGVGSMGARPGLIPLLTGIAL